GSPRSRKRGRRSPDPPESWGQARTGLAGPRSSGPRRGIPAPRSTSGVPGASSSRAALPARRTISSAVEKLPAVLGSHERPYLPPAQAAVSFTASPPQNVGGRRPSNGSCTGKDEGSATLQETFLRIGKSFPLIQFLVQSSSQ